MNRWAYTEVLQDAQGPDLVTTEPSVIDELFSALKQLEPSARVSRDPNYSKLGVCWAEFHWRDKTDYADRLWLIGRLGELGWQPFAIHPSGGVALRKASLG